MDGMNELTIGFSASATKQEQLNELMEQADALMYQQKKARRNAR